MKKWIRETPSVNALGRMLVTEINEDLICRYLIKYEDGQTDELEKRDLSWAYVSIEEFLDVHNGFKEVENSGL